MLNHVLNLDWIYKCIEPWHSTMPSPCTLPRARAQRCRCGRHAARLRKLGSPLLFRLRLQEFVSLIRRDERAAALAHARAHLQEFAREPENFAEFRTAFALLVIPRGTKCPRYARLLAPARWRALAELFVRELLSVHGLCTVPLLELQLQVRRARCELCAEMAARC